MNFCVWLIALLLSIGFAFNAWHGSAWEWPAIDVGPALIRQMEGGLIGDFTATATAGVNPREPFIALSRGLAWARGGDWLAGLGVIKALVVVLLPAALFMALLAAAARVLPRGPACWTAAVVLWAAVALGGMDHGPAAWFVVAQWRPLPLQATPQALSLTVAGIAAALALRTRCWCWQRAVAAVLLSLAVMLHPVIGMLVTLATATTLGWLERSWRQLVLLSTPALLVALAVQVGLGGRTDLTPIAAADVYVRLRHPHHYLLARLDSLSARPWWWHAMLISALPLVTGLVLRWTGNPRRGWLFITLAFGFAAVPLVHWLVVEWRPTLFGLGLGLTRAYLFGWWSGALAVAVLAGLGAQACARGWRWRSQAACASSALLRIGVPVVYLGVIVGVILSQRDPRPGLLREHASLHAWLAELPPEAVVAMPPERAIETLVLDQRPVLLSGIFPFGLGAWREYGERWRALYGGIGSVPAAAYRAHTAAEIVAIAERWRLDAWVMPRDAALPHITADFQDEQVFGYLLSQLRELTTRDVQR